MLVVFWATWCAPCRAEAPAIAEAYQRFKDQGLVVIGINPDDPLTDVQGFIDQFHMPGLTARESLDGTVHKQFRVVGWPSHFLIGKDGRILANAIEVSQLNDAIMSAIRAR